MLFENRKTAGRQLAQELKQLKIEPDIILALPRGGVVVAAEVAKVLKAKLDVLIVRKLGAPDQEELAIGALAETGAVLLDHQIIETYGIGNTYIADIIAAEKARIRDYQKKFREGKKLSSLSGKKVMLVDDGVATGFTVKAAIDACEQAGAKEIYIAAPVAPPDTCTKLEPKVDKLIVLQKPFGFFAIGQFYEDFEQVESWEVKEILKKFDNN
jgi:putative phosphoribosyl transferase